MSESDPGFEHSDESSILADDSDGVWLLERGPSVKSLRANIPESEDRDWSDSLGVFVTVQGAWMWAMVIVLLWLEQWSFELYFALSFLGLLGVRVLLAPTRPRPDWWARLNWVVRFGFLVLGYLVYQQSMAGV